MTAPGGRHHKAVLIAGPTAGGKSALAASLAEAVGGVVINADSMQVYRELRILTARPSRHEERALPHRLYGIAGAGERFSAGHWLKAAENEIAAARAAGRAAILVGGTGLYFSAVLGGLSAMPPVPAGIRDKWQALWREEGHEAVCARLEALDPQMAARIEPGDRQRMLRALEVADATGRSLADWQHDAVAPVLDPQDAIRVVVAPERAGLYRRIDARAAGMVASGALEEADALAALGLDPALPAMKAIGVRELGAVGRGDLSLEAALAAMQTATRRYAKRQLTWARGRMSDWRWVEDGEAALEAIIALARG